MVCHGLGDEDWTLGTCMGEEQTDRLGVLARRAQVGEGAGVGLEPAVAGCRGTGQAYGMALGSGRLGTQE